MFRLISIGVVLVLLVALPATAQDLERGLAAYKSGDYAAALTKLLPLARRGNPVAQGLVGVIYHNGLGTKADLAKAVDWYGKAAKNGDATSQRILGDLYIGGVGGSPDYVAAAEWYEAAATGGDAEAQRKLGELYRLGRGVRRDPQVAAHWLNRAKEQGDPGARRKLQGARVTPPSRQHRKHDRSRTGSLRQPSSCVSGMTNAPYHVDVKIKFSPIKIDHSRTIAELGKISGLGHRGRILGLMKPEIRLNTLPMAKGMSSGNEFCFWINGFEIVLGYSKLGVYVAKEYPVGSCPYKATREHELQHVQVARENLERFAPRIRKALMSGDVPTGQTPIIVASAAEAARDVREISKEILRPIYESMVRALRNAQGKLDSPQSYARVFRRCSNW